MLMPEKEFEKVKKCEAKLLEAKLNLRKAKQELLAQIRKKFTSILENLASKIREIPEVSADEVRIETDDGVLWLDNANRGMVFFRKNNRCLERRLVLNLPEDVGGYNDEQIKLGLHLDGRSLGYDYGVLSELSDDDLTRIVTQSLRAGFWRWR